MKFRIIVSDPAWEFSDKLTMSDVKRGAASNYSTLTVDELCKLPVERIAENDSVLVLWCPATIIDHGFRVMKSWGFSYKQIWVWVKTTSPTSKVIQWKEIAKAAINMDLSRLMQLIPLGFGMGRLARATKEIALVGIKGKPYQYLKNKSVRDVFFAPSTSHSVKPECVQDALDIMFPDCSKLEMFARRPRENWFCIGDEALITEGEDIRDTLRWIIES